MATLANINAQRKKAGATTVRKDQRVDSRNSANIVAEQERVSANTKLNNPRFGFEKGNAPLGYQQDTSGASNTPISTIWNTPANSNNPAQQGGNIDKLRELRLSGEEGGVNTGGDAYSKGDGVYYGNGEAQLAATPEQRARNAQNLKGIANVGFNVTPAERSRAARLERQQAEIANTKGYVPRTVTNEDGTTTTTYSEDKGATENAQNDAKNRQAQEDLTGEMQAEGRRDFNEQNPSAPPVPPSDTFFTNLPEDQRGDAMGTFQPMFDYIDSQMGNLMAQQQIGMDAISEVGGNLQTYVDAQRARDTAMLDRFDSFYKDQLNSQLNAADSTKEAQYREQDLARDRAEFEFDRAIRDQQIQNEKNRKDQLLGLGISGGWRSSRHSADVIDALSAGDRIVSDLRTQKAFMERDFGNKFSDIEADWNTNINAAHDKYKASSLALVEKAMNKAGELDKMVFQNTTDKINAIAKLKSDFVTGYGLMARDFAQTVTEQNKFMIQQANDIEKQQYERRNKMWDQALRYVDTYGTQNKAELRVYEDALGLMPGALSNQQTLEELRMRKETGSGVGGGAMGSYVDNKIAELQSVYPNANMDDILTMAYHELNDEVGGESASGRAKMDSAKQYMYGKYGKDLPPGKRINTILNKTTKDGTIYSAYEDAKSNAYYGSTLNTKNTSADAVATYYDLVAGGMSKEDAREYIANFGWEIEDPWYSGPSGKKK